MALPLLPLLGAAAKGLGSGMARGAAKNFITGKKRDKKPVEQKKPDNNQSMSGEKGSLTLRPKVSLIPSETFATPETETTESKSRTRTSDPLKLIKIKVLKIDKILKKRYTSDLKKTKTLKRIREDTRRKNQEQQLEKVDPTGKKDGNTKKLNLPGKGLFSGIFNFLKNILLGRLLVLLLEARPNLPGGNILMFIANTAEKIIDLIIGAIDGFGSFLLAGKNVIDSSKEWLENNRGPEAKEKFDELLESLKKVFNAIVVVGSVFAVGKAIGRGKKTPTPSKPQPSPSTRPGAIRRFTKKYGRDAAIKKFGKDAVTRFGGSAGRSTAEKLSRNAAVKLFGKSGTKAGLKILKNFISPVVKRIPILGGLIDFALNYFVFKEPIGRAAFAAIGATIFGALGATAGSILPFAGNVVGGALGTLAGDKAGKWLYDTFFDKKKPVEIEDDLAPEGTDRSGARGTGSFLGLGSQNAVTSLTMVEGGSLKGLTEKDYADLAFIVSGEAQRGTDDEYGVAAAVLNRVSDPRYPNNIQAVGAAPGQFEAVFKGLAYYDEGLIKKLMSPEGQAKIVDALIKLKGRTDFKGTSMYQYMGQGDVKFSSRGNFYHYPEQREKSDPPPASIPNFYQNLIDKSGAIGGNLGQMPELLKSMSSASQIMSKPITDSLMMFTDYERPPEPQIIMAGVGGGQSPTVPPDDNQSTFIDNAFGGRPTEREKWNDIRYKFG